MKFLRKNSILFCIVLLLMCSYKMNIYACECELEENTVQIGTTYYNLSQGEEYVYFFVKNVAESFVNSDNLLYIEQATANANGNISFSHRSNGYTKGTTAIRGTDWQNAEEITWGLSSDGILTIYGNGDMKDADSKNPAPWDFISENISTVKIKNSITRIGELVFENCINLKRIEFEGDAPNFAENCFSGVNATVYYPKDNSTWTESVRKNYGGNIIWKTEETETPSVTNPFTDVPESMYYYKPVVWALKNNVTAGINATEFAPEQSCTRGQVVTFLWRAMGCPEPSTTTNPFVDVPEYEYYYKAVLWALESGITAGTDATHFAPNDTVTRGQFVTFLHRAENKPSYSVSNPFTDVPNTYYYDAVLWAYENGVTAGINETQFAPEQSCTRGQVVTFLYRALNEKEEDYPELPEVDPDDDNIDTQQPETDLDDEISAGDDGADFGPEE